MTFMLASRAAAKTRAVGATMFRTGTISRPARANAPPSLTKSFCMSTTITAVRLGSIVNGMGLASIDSVLLGESTVASFPLWLGIYPVCGHVPGSSAIECSPDQLRQRLARIHPILLPSHYLPQHRSLYRPASIGRARPPPAGQLV